MHRPTSTILTIILSITIAGCEIDTRATVDGKNPPSFRVSGSGGIYFIRVVDITDCNKSLLDCPILWQIDPAGGHVSIADLPLVTYGRVPQGFHQTIPVNDAPPPVLVEGKMYDAWTPTYGANGGGVRFFIKAGKSVEFR
jgi:hypothetical protein